MPFTVEQSEVFKFLRSVARIGNNTARALADQIPSMDQIRVADPERIKQALLQSRLFSMEGAAERKARKYYESIQESLVSTEVRMRSE